MPRPKSNKKHSSSSSIFLSNLITTSSSNELNGNRVVINPAVLRYLEQNRNDSNKNLPINSIEGKDENFFEQEIEQDMEINHNLLWDFYTYSTEFLTTARLAEWILNHQQTL